MVTSSGPMPSVMLEIDTEEKTMAEVPNGYRTVMRPKIESLQMPTGPSWIRTIVGWIALVAVVVLLGVLAWREPTLRTRT